MRPLAELLRLRKQIRVIGFDDAPFEKQRGAPVRISGIVCTKTRFEGMLWGQVSKDGMEATDTLSALLIESKFYSQVNVVLTDGVAVGGFNIIDLPKLANTLKRPCIALMRKPPDLEAIDKALQNFPDYLLRKKTLLKAGKIHKHNNFHFQVQGCEPEVAAQVLEQATDRGNVPEALRLAHMIGAAVMTGQSGKRA
ncbi:DUF99 domain-containing protein [Microbulbifer sp. A4B17]|uniref:endonuclease dU n=1 Tax=Microbulbifer sp. A4B17 TaxID=359370 RepID=UPI000D52AC4B|nr:DUF99 family protein [Microbulbifer sp. A4B17]AWF82082.1 DUF99 domain-containing protein [Microbulbifer sp. A4B17]